MHNDTPFDIRCGQCGRLLARGLAIDLSIKCPRCGAISHLRTVSPGPERPERHGENKEHDSQ